MSRSYRPCSSRVVAMHSRLGRLPAKTWRCSFAYFCCQCPQAPPDAGSAADRDRLTLATKAMPAIRATSTNTVTGVSLRRLLRRRNGMRLLANQHPCRAYVPAVWIRVRHPCMLTRSLSSSNQCFCIRCRPPAQAHRHGCSGWQEGQGGHPQSGHPQRRRCDFVCTFMTLSETLNPRGQRGGRHGPAAI